MSQQPPKPFVSLIDEWARALHAENKSPKTIRCYTDAARKFHLWCADLDQPPAVPGDITPTDVRDWIAHRLDTTSPGNANNNYRCMQQWFNWLLNEDEIDTHPMARLKSPHVPDQPPPIVPDDLMRAVLDTCSGRDLISRRDTAIIRLIFDTGARLSEVGNLKVDDLDLNLT